MSHAATKSLQASRAIDACLARILVAWLAGLLPTVLCCRRRRRNRHPVGCNFAAVPADPASRFAQTPIRSRVLAVILFHRTVRSAGYVVLRNLPWAWFFIPLDLLVFNGFLCFTMADIAPNRSLASTLLSSAVTADHSCMDSPRKYRLSVV